MYLLAAEILPVINMVSLHWTSAKQKCPQLTVLHNNSQSGLEAKETG